MECKHSAMFCDTCIDVCPMCEIDRLKGLLQATKNLAVLEKVQFMEERNQLIQWQADAFSAHPNIDLDIESLREAIDTSV